jgi:SAM-dependent methyltransferase
MNTFWNDRFLQEGKIWGDTPSRTAACAADRFVRDRVRSVLVPGSGYGRNAVFFHTKGFEVTGIEMSGEALRLAEEDNPGITYHHGSVLACRLTIAGTTLSIATTSCTSFAGRSGRSSWRNAWTRLRKAG